MKTLLAFVLAFGPVFAAAQTLDPTFAPQFTRNGRVEHLAPSPGGGAVVAGSFNFSGTDPVPEVTRLLADGTTDPAFSADPGIGAIRALAVQADGKTIVGTRDLGNGISTGRLLRLNIDGTVDNSFSQVALADRFVRHIHVIPNQRILVASADPESGAYRMDLLEPTGLAVGDFIPVTFGNGSREFAGIAAQADDALLVMGTDLVYAGMVQDGFRFDATGTVDAGFDPAILTQGNFAVVDFAVGADKSIGVIDASLEAFTWLDSIGTVRYSTTIDAGNSFQAQLTADRDGSFFVVGENLVELGPGGASITYGGLGVQPDAFVRTAITTTDGRLLAGGIFDRAAGQNVTGLVAYRTAPGNPAVDDTFTASLFQPAEVTAVVEQPDGRFVAGGDFVYVNGNYHPYLARIYRDGELDESFPASAPPQLVLDMAALDDGRLVVSSRYNDSETGLALYSADGSDVAELVFPVPPGAGSLNYVANAGPASVIVGAGRSETSQAFPGGRQATRRYNFTASGYETVDYAAAYFDSLTRYSGILEEAGGGHLYFGRNIAYDGGPPAPIVRALPGGSRAPGFSAAGLPDFLATSLAVHPSSGRLFVAGEFVSQDGSSTAPVFYVLNGDGSLYEDLSSLGGSTLPGGSTRVQSISVLPEGNVLVTGSFDRYRDTPLEAGQIVIDQDGNFIEEYAPGTSLSKVNYVLADEAGGTYLAGSVTGNNGAAGMLRLTDPSFGVEYRPTAIEGANWIVEDSETPNDPYAHFVRSVRGDTIVDGVTYKKLYQRTIDCVQTENGPPLTTPYEVLPGEELIALLRDEPTTRRVYGRVYSFWSGADNWTEDVLIHDYAQGIGEALRGELFDLAGGVVVDEVGTADRYGAERRFQQYGNARFYEGIGSPYAGALSGDAGFFNNGSVYRLIEYCVGDYATCNIVSPVTEFPTGTRIRVFPNPFTDQLEVVVSGVASAAPITVRLRDLSGRMIREEVMRNGLRWSGLDLAPGVYLISYVSAGRSFTEKLVRH